MTSLYVFLLIFCINEVKSLYNPNYPIVIINANRSLVTELTTAKSIKVTLKYYETYSTPQMTRKVEHVPIVLDKTCLLIPEVGPCRAKIPMYFYDPYTKNCNVFNWGGCQGNGNRFDRLEDCMGRCLSSPGYSPGQPRYCRLTYDYGWCFGAEERWYYDFRYKNCKKTIYSGCGGNKNNFYNREQCDSICRFGNGPLYTGQKRNTNFLKKVLIVDPPNAKTTKLRIIKEISESLRKNFESTLPMAETTPALLATHNKTR